MTTVYSSLFSSNFNLLSPNTQPTRFTCLNPHFPPIQCNNSNKKRRMQLPAVASITYPPINVEYLASEFSGHGVTFEDISDDCCVVRMGLDNGSIASLMLPSGLITSYKAHMWHGGVLELLHTTVSEGENGDAAVIQGGVSLAFSCQSSDDDDDDDDDDAVVSWSPNYWSLREVRGNPQESIRVEVVSSNAKDMMIEVKHILTLQEDALSSELVVSNNSNSTSLRLTGCVTSHLTVSTPEATYAVGLEGSDFHSRPPFQSEFSIIPPESGQRNFFWTWGAGVRKSAKKGEEKDAEGREDEDYKHLTDKMSRIYTSAPRNFTIIDRGRRNSVVVGRGGGFDELYMFSPGSSHEWYGEYAYICVGQSALLEPIILNPHTEWRGSQHLHNPNL